VALVAGSHIGRLRGARMGAFQNTPAFSIFRFEIR